MIHSLLVRSVLAGLALAFCLQSSVSAANWVPLTITKLTLVNSLTNQDIRVVSSNDVIDLSKDGSRITLRADVAGKVGSVAFLLNGKVSSVENTAPYSLHGDSDGDFKRWEPKPGTHTLRVIPYPSRNRGGQAGEAKEITLRVVAGNTTTPAPQPEPEPQPEPQPVTHSVTKLILINAKTDKELRELTPGATVSLAEDGTEFSVRAVTSGTVSSVQFYLNGKARNLENTAPYSIEGDTNGDYLPWKPSAGSYTVRAVPYSAKNAGGKVGTAKEITINVVAAAPQPEPQPTHSVTKLILINAKTDKELRELTPGATVSLAEDGTEFSVRAVTSGTVSSVQFYLNGKARNLENTAPYSIEGDTNGDYLPWKPSAGSYTVRAVPYSAKNAGGKVGTAKEITMNVVATTSLPDPQPGTEPEDSDSDSGNSNNPPSSSTGVQLYKANGQMDLSVYGMLAFSYDKATMEKRLGPSFLDLSPNAPDDRPTLFRPVSHKRVNGYARTNPYELGGPPKTDGDYWSESGQVAYIPDNASNPGLDRIQVYAYYDKVFAISPRLDWASGRPSPDLQTTDGHYVKLFGEAPKQPIAMVRNYGMQTNEALVLYRDGYLAVAGTQTSRNGSERPYPGFVFPANKVPTNVAITTANEFALVTIWDTDTKKGQLAVFALEGKYLPFHTWPYMAMPNQGSWSGFKLLGYVDLPMNTPTSVATASNGFWNGPSQTAGKVLSQIDLAKDGDRKNVYDGSWAGVVAKNGYAMVASKYDNTVAIVDLTPLFAYVREAYLSSATSYRQTLANRGTGASNFPEAFSVKPAIKPTVVWQSTISKPTAVLAGHRMDRWTSDHYKGYVASEDGTISIIDTSSLMKRYTWEKLGALRVIGSFNVGRNPVDMVFARRGDSNLPVLPYKSNGEQARPDPYNNLFYIAVRGDRKVVAAVTFKGEGAIYRTIKDKRMGDPVAVSTAIRGPILSVTDFRGKKMMSFRIGAIEDNRNKKVFGAGADGKAEFEYTGEVSFEGYPFLINTTNVN